MLHKSATHWPSVFVWLKSSYSYGLEKLSHTCHYLYSSLIHNFASHDFSYLQSNVGQNYYMEYSRNKQFMSFTLCTLLSSVMKSQSCLVLPKTVLHESSLCPYAPCPLPAHYHLVAILIYLTQQISIECQLWAQFYEVMKKNENLSCLEPWPKEAWQESNHPHYIDLAICGKPNEFYLELRFILCEIWWTGETLDIGKFKKSFLA